MEQVRKQQEKDPWHTNPWNFNCRPVKIRHFPKSLALRGTPIYVFVNEKDAFLIMNLVLQETSQHQDLCLE